MRKREKADDTMARRWRESMLRFLEVELHASETFLKLAVGPHYYAERDYVGLAREAYFAVDHFSERIPMSLGERKSLRKKLSVLKERLAELGAFFEKPIEPGPTGAVVALEEARSKSKMNVGARVAGFLELCEEARATAERIVAVNREMMEARPAKQAKPAKPVAILRAL